MNGARSGPRSGKPRRDGVRAVAFGVLITGLAAACSPATGGPEVYRTVNRTLSVLEEATRSFVRLDSGEGDGLAVMDGLAFSTGVLEVLVRGEDEEGRSSRGTAFARSPPAATRPPLGMHPIPTPGSSFASW